MIPPAKYYHSASENPIGIETMFDAGFPDSVNCDDSASENPIGIETRADYFLSGWHLKITAPSGETVVFCVAT